MDLDIDLLRAVANNLRPHPTVYGTLADCYGVESTDDLVVEMWAIWDPEEDDPPELTCALEEDALFYATFNRETVLAILDELEALRNR